MNNENSEGMRLGQISDKLDTMSESIAKLSEMQTLMSVQLEDLEKLTAEYPDKEILNVSEASRFLGISKHYLYKLVQANEIPFHKPHGRLLLFFQNELRDWIKVGFKMCDNNDGKFK